MQRTMNELVAACRDVSPEPTRSAPCKATNDLIEQEPCQRMETGESLAVSVAQEPPLQPPRSLSASGVNQHQQDQTETERSQHPPRSSLTPRMPLSYSTHLPLSHPSHPQLPGTTTSTSSTSRRYYEYPPPPAESHAWHSQQQQQQQSTERRDTRARIDSSSPSKRTSPPPQQVLPTAAESVRTNGCTCKKSRCLKLYCQCFASSTTCGSTCKCVACHNGTLHAADIEKARATVLDRNPTAFHDKFPDQTELFPCAVPADWSAPRHHPPRYSFPPLAPPPPYPQRLQHLNQHEHQQNHGSASASYSYSPPQYAAAAVATSTAAAAPPPLRRVNKYGCKCKRSFCLKKYCECFQNATHCGLNCKCTNCKNHPNKDHGGAAGGRLMGAAAAAAVTTELYAENAPVWTAGGGGGYLVSPEDYRHAQRQVLVEAAPPQPPSSPPRVVETTPERNDQDEDRMTMLAAMAMAQLSGIVSTCDETESEVQPQKPAPILRRISNDREDQRRDNTTSSPVIGKRKAHNDEALKESVPTKRHKPKGHSTAMADAEVRAVVSSTSSLSMESRNPSPVSSHMQALPYYPPADRFPFHPMPPPSHYSHGPSHSHHGPHSQFGVRTSPPHHLHHPQHMPPRYLQPSPPPLYNPRSSPVSYMRSSPISFYNGAGVTPSPYRRSPVGSSNPGGCEHEMLQSSGLPRSLSFRKICSKCGKTRGEHGELGFGNKCVYQECGKCGAGLHMHVQAAQPMGVLCCLTEQDGAVVGAAASYERKIRELAARADMQKELSRRKEEAAAASATAVSTGKELVSVAATGGA